MADKWLQSFTANNYFERIVMKTRLINYDLMRVVMCIFVIIDHISEKPFSFPVRAAYTTFFFLAISVFYMLSGKFNLEQTFGSVGDYINYYRKKFVSIYFPYMLVSFMLSVCRLYGKTGSLAPKEVFFFAFKEFFDTNSEKSLWFMYPLMGLLISAPFLSKMFHAMSDRECLLMAAIAVIWNVVKVYLTSDIGVTFNISGWLLDNWCLYFVAGYLSDRLVNEKNRKVVYLLGIAGFIITVAIRVLSEDHMPYCRDYSPAFFLFSVAAYDFMSHAFKVTNPVIVKVVSFIAQNTFMIYLLHMPVLNYVVPRFVTLDTTTVPGYLLQFAFAFICSLAGAIVLRTLIIRPLQSLLRKLPGLRLSQQEKLHHG